MKSHIVAVLLTIVATWLTTDYIYFTKHQNFIKNLQVEIVDDISEQQIRDLKNQGMNIRSIKRPVINALPPGKVVQTKNIIEKPGNNKPTQGTTGKVAPTENTTGNPENRRPVVIISSPRPVAQADDSGSSFGCANAGNDMERCKTQETAVSCAQMACKLNSGLLSVGERFSLLQQYDIGFCSSYEDTCGFDGPDGGGGGGGGGDDDGGGGCNGGCEVECPWWGIICRSVHSSSTVVFW